MIQYLKENSLGIKNVDKKVGKTESLKAFSLSEIVPKLPAVSSLYIVNDGQLKLKCASNTGFLCTLKLHYDAGWSLKLIDTH